MRLRFAWLAAAALVAAAVVGTISGSLGVGSAASATTLPPCTASNLVPQLGAVTINQGVGSYANERLARGKDALVRFYLKLPAAVGTTCSGSINVINTTASPTRMTIVDASTADDGFVGDLPNPIAPYQTYPSTGHPITASSVQVNSNADPIFVLPAARATACDATPCGFLDPFSLQFKARVYYTTSAGTSSSADFSTMPGTSNPITGNFSKLSNDLRVLVIPMGDASQLYSTQFDAVAQQVVQNGMNALSRLLPVRAGVSSTLRTIEGGIRYWIDLAAMLNLKSIPGAYPSGSTRFCGTQQNFDGTAANNYADGIKAKLAWYLQTYNSNPANAQYPADRVLGVVSSAISDGSTSSLGCAEGFASTNSPEAWVRAIPDVAGDRRTPGAPSMTGALMAHELLHTFGQENAPVVHSPNTQADGTAPDRGYNVTNRSFIANDRTVMNFVSTSTAPWNNNTTLLELGAFGRALCNLGGSFVNFGCTSTNTVGSLPAGAGTGHFVISATTDGTAPNTHVESSHLLRPNDEARDLHPVLETPCLAAASTYNLFFFHGTGSTTQCNVPTSVPIVGGGDVGGTAVTIAGAFPSPGGVTKVQLRKGTTVLHEEIVHPGGIEITGGSLAPGSSFSQTKTITTPEILPTPDIYFLADTTGSMGPALANVQGNASEIVETVEAEASDPRFGAGDYRDFRSCGDGEAAPCFADGYAFNPDHAPIPASDDNGTAALAAIDAWSPLGGLDDPEGQFFALDRLSSPTFAGWRSDSSRILVWFGDNPGHDPICAGIRGEEVGLDITKNSVVAALSAEGIRVIAVTLDTDGTGTSSTGLNGNLADDGAGDYAAACGDFVPEGSVDQATAIAEATGGVVKEAASAEEVSDEILAGLTNLPASVTPVPDCDEDLSMSFDPENETVTSGEPVTFTENVDISEGATPGETLTCEITFQINGQVMTLEDGETPDPAFQQTITVLVDTASTEITVTAQSPVKADAFIECDGGQLPAGQTAIPASAVAGSISTFLLNADTTNACAKPDGSDPELSVSFTDGTDREILTLSGTGTNEGGDPAKDESPTASIYAPELNYTNPVHKPFALDGQVVDPDDGPLTPTWTITGPVGTDLGNGSNVISGITGNFADVPPPPGGWPLGDYTVAVTATDSDGHSATATAIVHVRSYVFSGFLPPIRPLPTVNDGKVKSTIPIKWQLRDEQTGSLISDLGAVAAIRVASTPCPTSLSVCDVTPTGGTMLRYDTRNNQYVFNWLTPSQPGQYVVSVHFTDGSTYSAYFKLSK